MRNFLACAHVLATAAHSGQTDKSGQPYILHPRRVAASVADLGAEYEIVALLHDVVEDSDVTLADLYSIGFPNLIVSAVDALTHRPNEPQEDYLSRVVTSEVAITVKRADIADNSRPDRMVSLDDTTKERLTRKYAKATAYLDRYTP